MQKNNPLSGPAPPASSCSLSCSGRNFWTGYKLGTTFQYAFEQKVVLTSPRNQQKSVLMQVTGKANVEVHSDCEMVLTVDVQSTKTSKSPSEAMTMDAKSLPKALADALKEPLRFSFEDGRIASLCPGAETRASLNFKRGLLSQLHVSIDKPDQDVRVREDDVLGSCWTEYAKLGANKFEKTKDLSSCTNNFEVFPRQGVKFEAPEATTQWPTVAQGTLKCSIELDSESMVIKENNCEEERKMEMGMVSSPGETVKVTTSLKLQQKTSALASALAEVKERSGLAHKHKTTDKCHDSKSWFEEDIFHTGNECLEKKVPTTGTTSADFKARATKVIEELCEETKSNNMLNSTAEKYGELIKYLRGITSQEDFTSLFDWAKGYCGDNSMLKVIVYSAVPSVGTQQSVKVMLNQLKGSDGMSTEKNTASWLVNGIAMMPHPTPEIIADVLEFTKKAKEDSMMIVSKDQPLALSAVTGKYCSLNPNCESDDTVDAVLTFFADSLGANCSNLESQSSDDQFAADYAFVALLSIGNIGRAKGGAASIIGCAENAKLSLANRAFALRALRRFPKLITDETLRLGDLIKNKDLDSELRITAYQIVARTATASFWSKEQVIKKLSDLFQDEREDQQLQRYVYAHLRQWLKKQRLSTDSYTVSNILRDYERLIMNSQLSGMQVSNYWRKQFRSQYTKSKMELESSLIYSSNSMMPRFANFNFTVESPLSGETVNMFEFGVRMEGMEGMMEQVFNAMNKDDRSDELIRKRRQASPELTEQQKQYKQAAKKIRLDVYTRKNGMELMHNNFDDTILGVVPQFMKTLDLANVQGLAQEKLSSLSFDTVGQAAGSGMETTTSFPTIAGFPILLKKELHYLTNIGFKQSFDAPSMFEVKMGLEVQPTVSVHMARTVLVDSGFERAGLRSQTSGLTSIGVKIDLEGSVKGPGDIKFSFKLDPLKKQQKLLELKTDILFIQHSGPSKVVANPVVAPSEMAPFKTKCSTSASVKLFGRRMCLETNFETTTYSPEFFAQQNPGSFRLFIDKDDSFGVYEVTFKIKREGSNCEVMAVVGDQKSPDRHAKFQFSISRSSDPNDYSRKVVLELANPVLPIKWESESKKKGEDYDVTVGLKFGSTDYAFKGAWSREAKVQGWKLSGNFFRKDKERQQLAIVTKFASYGLLKYLPMYRFEFEVTTPSNEKLTFNEVLYYDSSSNKFEASLLASHEKSGSVVTSIKSRLQVIRTQREGAGQTRAFIYDTEVVTKAGKNFMHAFSAKIDRKRKESAADTWVSTVSISHKFKHGMTKENSLFDTDASLQLEETTKGSMYKAIGSGTITYQADSTKKTAKLSNLRLVLGESDVIFDHFNTKTFLLEIGTENDGSQSQALVAVQVLPLKHWSLNNHCLYVTMKATTNSQTHAFEIRHTSAPDKKIDQEMPVLVQSAKLQYASAVLLDATHKFYPISVTRSDTVLGHFFNLTTYDRMNYFINSKLSISTQANTLKIATTYELNQQRKGQLDQTITIDSYNRRFEYQMKCQMSAYDTSFRVYFQNPGYEEWRKASAEVFSYLQNTQRKGFRLGRFAFLVRQYIGKIKVESGLQMNIPSSINLRATSYIDMTIKKGILMNFTRDVNYAGQKQTMGFQIYKEMESVTGKYSRSYKVDVQNDNAVTTYRLDTVFLRNHTVTLSLSKASSSEGKSTDFHVTTAGRFLPKYKRDGQIALELNMTHKYSWAELTSDFRVVVDTMPEKYLNPAINVSLLVASSSERLTVSYDAGVERMELSQQRSITNIKALTSGLQIKNSFSAIPFSSYRGVTTLSSSRNVPFDFVFKKTLESSDIINIRTTLNSEKVYVGLKSDMLPAKEVSFQAQFKQEADGFISYLSQIKLNVKELDLTIKDTGKIKFAGQSGTRFFSTVYSGAIEINGLQQIVGNSFSMDKLDYSGLLEAKTIGEFNSNFQVFKVKGASSENLLLLSAKLNYWPFEVSAQIKTPLGMIDQYGFNISVGPSDNGGKFKASITSPKKETVLAFSHAYKKGEKIELTDQLTFTSDHLFSSSSDMIDSVLNVRASSMYDYTFLMNMTTPYKQFQLAQWDIVTNDQKLMIAFTLKANDKQDKVLNLGLNFQTMDDGRKLGKATFFVTSIVPQWTGWKKVTCDANLVTGGDYLIGFEVSLDDAKLAVFDILWLKAGNSYPHLSRLSVQGANMGVDFKAFYGGSQKFQFYVLRSGDAAKTKWQSKYKLGETEVQTSLDIVNGIVTSGSGSGLGKSFTFARKSDGVIEVKAASAGGTNSITYSSSMSDNTLSSLKLKFSFSSKESCISYTKQAQQINVEYGSCNTPNKLQISYQISDFWTLTKSKVQIGVEHTTVPASNQAFYWLPDVSVPLGIPQFKFNIDGNNEKRQGKLTFDSSEMSVKYFQEIDFSKFPRALKFTGTAKIGASPMKNDHAATINYDYDTRIVDVRIEASEIFKLVVSNMEFSIYVVDTFTAGVAYKTEPSTNKIMIEMKGELRPTTTSQANVLRLWQIIADGGRRYRYALELTAKTGKDINIVCDVTNVKYTATEFSMNMATALSSTMIENFRTVNSVAEVSFLQDSVNKNYTINYKESFTSGGVVYYEIKSLMKGRAWKFPSTMNISFPRGYFQAELSYNFNPEYNTESHVLWSLSKFGENRNIYIVAFRTKDESNLVEKIWRDFSLEISSPRRQIYLSESWNLLPNGTVQAELQAYLNKRNLEGFALVFSRDFTQPNVFRRNLRLTLPTRQVGYDRELKVKGNKLEYNLVFFWDMHSALDKKITIDFNRERERRASGYYYYHRLNLTAPFLKNKISKELLYETKENEFTLSVTHTVESDDKVTLLVNGKQDWNAGRQAFQKEVNVSFTQKKGDVKANVRITVESSKVNNQKMPQLYSSNRPTRVINIFTTVPSLSIDSHVRIRNVPGEEFTYACNNGATFSLRYYTGFKRSRIFLFVSNSKKEAGQLTIVRDWLMSTLQATLDTGTGYMDPKSALSFPIYEPATLVVKATAGLSAKGKKVHFGVISGTMGVKNPINLWNPASVPKDLDFFFVGAKLNFDNTLGYASHWRIRQDTMKSPFTYAKNVLVDPWAKARNLPFGIDTINKLLKSVAQSNTKNIDTDAVLDLLTSISSNDIDSLKRWAATARDNNEFMSNTIGTYATYGLYTVKSIIESILSIRFTEIPSLDLQILSAISTLADATTRALNSIPITQVWVMTLNSLNYGSEVVSTYFSAFVYRLDKEIKDRISTLTGGRGSSIVEIVFNAVSSVYPIRMVYEKFTTVVEVAFTSLVTANVELANQLGNVLQPYVINTMTEIPRVYDFFENMIYELNQWGVYLDSLIWSTVKDKTDKIEEKISGQSEFTKNAANSVVLLLFGDYKGAIRKFLNTDANVVNVWRISCDSACIASGSYAAVNGTVYIPFDVFTVVSFDRSNQPLQPFYASVEYGRLKGKKSLHQKFMDALEELRSERGLGGVVRRLIAPEHRTAEATGSYIKTFGGKELRNLSPCRYLLAHDFQGEDFSIYQTYTWDGKSRKRGDLMIRFFNTKATISNNNDIKLNGESVSVPSSKKFDEQSVDIRGNSQAVSVTFNSELQNALKVKCTRSSDTCSVRVHPLYRGRLNGAFGSNDGNPANDLHGNSDSDHMRLWTTDSCIMS